MNMKKKNLLKALDKMLNWDIKCLEIEYLYLHQTVGNYLGGLKELEQAFKSGKVHAIGIFDFETDVIFNSLVEKVIINPQI